MKRSLLLGILLLAVSFSHALIAPSDSAAKVPLPLGVTRFFVGQTLDGWVQERVNATWSDPEHEMVGHLRDNVEALLGFRPPAIISLGGTDCRFWRAAGTPAYVYGCSHAGMGAPNESVAIDEFAVSLPDHDLIPLLVREIEEVDGASVEEWRMVEQFPDPRLDALVTADAVCRATSQLS